MPSGLLATADQVVTGEELSRATPHRLPVQLQAPNLVVKAVWTDEFGGEPVRRPEDGSPFVYGLMLVPSENDGAVIDEQGVARFYVVEAGRYKLVLTAAGQKHFTIVPPSDTVNVPAGDEPVVHVARFKPTVIESLSGLVIEEGTTSGVSTATVQINGSSVLTDEEGRFQLSVMGPIRKVLVSHQDYQPVTIDAPFERPLVVSLRSWPMFRGSVMVGDTAPMNATVRVYKNGQGKSIRIDKEGRWAEPLEPGEYFVTVRSWHVDDEAGSYVTPDEMIPVLLHQGPLQFDATTEALKLENLEVTDVRVRPGELPEGTPQPHAAMLLNDTGRILMSAPFHNGESEFKAVAGNYTVAVIFNDRSAQLINLSVEEGEDMDVEFDGRGRGRLQIEAGRLLIRRQ